MDQLDVPHLRALLASRCGCCCLPAMLAGADFSSQVLCGGCVVVAAAKVVMVTVTANGGCLWPTPSLCKYG